MRINLDPQESIELLVAKKKILPLKNEDWIKIPMFLFFLFMFYFITKNFSSKGFSEGFKIYFVFILIIALCFFFSVIKNYYKRYIIAFKWKYIITNKRLLVLNQEDVIEHSFNYDNFPQIEFGENLHGNGYIIIGKKEPFLAESKSLISYRVGVNFSEEDLILYNVENVKKLYHLIQSKITHYNIK